MRQRALGKSGLQASIVGLGCNNFGRTTELEASRKVVHKALDPPVKPNAGSVGWALTWQRSID